MIGEVIKDFRLTARLGRGGMGEVWVAEQQIIKTKVAIKLLREEVSGDQHHVRRLFNEAVAAGKIPHAGIAKIFDVGFHGNRAYLIMELLDGEPLANRIRQLGRLPLSQIVELGRQITSILAATHAAGITHRDLKPDNIFLVPDAELASKERVKVLDFGIAKLAETGATGLTSTGNSMGTPAYMAPEQWTDAAKADGRADIYSLGCVLFETSAGRPPFEVTSIGEACRKHMTETPARLRSLDARIPAELDELVARMLAKEPAERPALAEITATLAAITSPPSAAAGSARDEHDTALGAVATPPGSARVEADATLGTGATLPTGPVRDEHDTALGAVATLPPGSARVEVDATLGTGATLPTGSARDTALGTGALPGSARVDAPSVAPVARDSARVELDTTLGAAAASKPSPPHAPRSRFVAIAAATIAAGGVTAYFATRKSATTSPDAPPAVATTPTPPDAAFDAPAVAAPEVSSNPWIEIAPPATPYVLGVDATAGQRTSGLRPGRKAMTPSERFHIQQHEVTWGELDPWLDAQNRGVDYPVWAREPKVRDRLPATAITWDTAAAYCRSLGGGLPTEEQWEYAARGPEHRPNPWGDARLDRGRTHVYRGNSAQALQALNEANLQLERALSTLSESHPDVIAAKQRVNATQQRLRAEVIAPEPVMTGSQDQTPGPTPIFDLAGNVQEWTDSAWRDDSTDKAGESGESSFRAIRGFPLSKNPPDPIQTTSATYRQRACTAGACLPREARRRELIGFRCVKSR